MHGQVMEGDLLTAGSLLRFLEPGAVVINLAYMPDCLREDNLLATHNLARACASVGVSHLIHMSTAVVVGSATVVGVWR